ncbi:acyloxyacyl hydrolase [Ruegeria sp. HKCCD7255]|uniref:acyloxyacyl hydrolase n=1 Tax=Ruegeria sp. HKCCD7255 TaxID=2683004 RepID=UPI0014879205|nr:acyloxyacyl hydrolase [Ruegeria sp. HKCCD7255]
MKTTLTLIALTLAATAAQAESIILGAGYKDFSNSNGDDQATFSLEYQHRPFHEATRFSAGLGASLTFDTAGDTHIAAGLVGIYSFSDRWFAELSVMPGYFKASDNDNNLGGNFQIRSLLGVGYSLDNGNAISLAVTHFSNASTDSFNPGVNAVFLRYHIRF